MPPPRNVAYQSHPQIYEKLIILKCLTQYFLKKSAWLQSIKFLKTGKNELSLFGANNGLQLGYELCAFQWHCFV